MLRWGISMWYKVALYIVIREGPERKANKGQA